MRVRVGAPAVDGNANAELTASMAKTLRLPKSTVLLEKGDVSRFKTFDMPDGTDVDIEGLS